MRLPLATTAPEQSLSFLQKTWLGLEVLVTYVRVRWLMLRHDLPAAVTRLRGHSSSEIASAMPRFNKWRLADAIIRVLRILPTDSRCLMRSLVMLAMLERRGVPTTLVIGVKTDPKFEAHAWIEESGEALLFSGNGEYPQLTAI